MKIRPLTSKDRARLLLLLDETGVFTPQEIKVAMELIDIALEDQHQEDYRIHCAVNAQDEPFGYLCYGPTPMTQGTYDLYWIAVHPQRQREGLGSALLDFLEKTVAEEGGRMILAETSSTPEYETTHRFYTRRGYREVARVTDYYTPGNDRITFCKTLR